MHDFIQYISSTANNQGVQEIDDFKLGNKENNRDFRVVFFLIWLSNTESFLLSDSSDIKISQKLSYLTNYEAEYLRKKLPKFRKCFIKRNITHNILFIDIFNFLQ